MDDTTINATPSILRDRGVRMSLLAVFILLALFLAAQTLKTLKEYKFVGGGVMPVTTINVSGQGEVLETPTIATISFSVIEQGATVEAVQQAAATKANKVKAALAEKGIDKKDIQTTTYDVHPRYSYQDSTVSAPCPVGVPCPPPAPIANGKIVGFEAVESDTVKIRKMDSAGDILTALSGLGVQNIGNIILTVENEDIVKAQARDKAIAQAKEKANVLAKSLGVSLTRIVSFNEDMPYPMYSAMAKDAVSVGMGGSASGQAIPDISTGQNKIISNVMITYEIR